MIIEEGKTYVARDGEKWTNPEPYNPLHIGAGEEPYAWRLADENGSKFRFTSSGKLWRSGKTEPHDLVAEWVDPVDEPCPAQVSVEGSPLPEPFTHGDAIPAPPLTPQPGLFGSVTSDTTVMFPPVDYATVKFAQSYEDKRLDAIAASTDIKAEIADEAKRIVSGARRSAYGKPEDNFERIARFWQAYFENTGRGDVKITARDVSPMMRLMKEARLAETPDHRDSFVDLVGYTLTGAEVNGVKPA